MDTYTVLNIYTNNLVFFFMFEFIFGKLNFELYYFLGLIISLVYIFV